MYIFEGTHGERMILIGCVAVLLSSSWDDCSCGIHVRKKMTDSVRIIQAHKLLYRPSMVPYDGDFDM